MASVTFVSGNPRNDLKTEGSYLEVERQTESGDWEVVATDAYWETKYVHPVLIERMKIIPDTRSGHF